MAKKKAVIEFDIEKISDDVIKKKAHDDNVSLNQFKKEIKKHSRIRKLIPPDTSE
jgi:hypothetical protein